MDNKNKEKEKVVYVKVNEDNDDNRKNRLLKLFFIIGGSLTLITLIVLGIIFIPKLVKKSQSSSNLTPTSSEYSVSGDTETIYNNLLSYINSEAKDIDPSFETPKSVTSLKYNNHELEVTFMCDTYPGYFKANLPISNNVTEALYSFRNEVPVGMYMNTITKEENATDVTIKVGDLEVNTKTTKVSGLTPEYVSVVVKKSMFNIYCLCHEEHVPDKTYDNYISVKPTKDTALFDFYYYIASK